MQRQRFQKLVWDFYAKNKRDLPWRRTRDPYRILVSEIMLQQTQVQRVFKKYPEFVEAFPDFKALNKSSMSHVLKIWQGLGYNRRTLYLKKIAELVQKTYKAKLPTDQRILETFPGIGKATACSILVFSFNTPLLFIETNIRRVFIHEFFREKKEVHDKEILLLVEQALDKTNPREWYYALMDYGSHLAKNPPAGGVNPNRKSAHYKKQSKFQGSLRQIRGEVLKILLDKSKIKIVQLAKIINDSRFEKVIEQLAKEKFINIKNNFISLVK